MPAPPRTRRSNTTAPSPLHNTANGEARTHPRRFAFPQEHHLIVTTPSSVHAWDAAGVRKVFKSSKGGILAARASKDGNQVLAVADSLVVVLHDCKRGREESWGLNRDDGQVRLLEYAPDAKSLYLSTSLTGAIQCYSIHESRMLDPAQTHPSPPTVLAVNSTASLMISASDFPPVVYLQNLVLRTPAVQLCPAASETPVVAANFHPERPNIFLLAFKDGTIAAYDATRMARRNGVRMDVNSSTDTEARAGEIGRFKQLHKTTNTGNIDPEWAFDSGILGSAVRAVPAMGRRSVGITAAAFMPGYQTRAVSVGGDGRCRLVEFGAGSKVLRTWHAQGPVTSLSVLPLKDQKQARESTLTGSFDRTGASEKETTKTWSKTITGGPTSTNNMVAVGREDGRVILFDSLGLHLQEISINSGAERIIGIEWIKGPAPNPIFDGKMLPPGQVREARFGLIDPEAASLHEKKRLSEPRAVLTTAALAEHDAVVAQRSITMADKAVFLSPAFPLEEGGTVVRHTTFAQAPPVELTANYLDLFSPIKQYGPPVRGSPKFERASPSHAAPRPPLLSTTFIRQDYDSSDVSPKTTTDPSKSTVFSSDLGSPQRIGSPPRPLFAPPNNHLPAPLQSNSPWIPPTRRNTTFMVQPGHQVSSSSDTVTSTSNTASDSTRNGQILADLRRVGAKDRPLKAKRKSGNKAFFAPYMNRTAASDIRRRSQGHLAAKQNTDQKQTSPSTTAVSSVYDTPKLEDQGDIWITSGSETETQSRVGQPGQHRKQHKTPKKRDKMPTSRMSDNKGGGPSSSIRTKRAATMFYDPVGAPPILSPEPRRRVPAPPPLYYAPAQPGMAKTGDVLSSSDQAMYTAPEHFSSGVPVVGDGTFSPPSQELRELFPRGSSLSPSRKGVAGGVLRDLGPGAVNRRAGLARAVGQMDAKVLRTGGDETSPKRGRKANGVLQEQADGARDVRQRGACDGCCKSSHEVRELKAEMSKMKAEMLAMKMALRQAGM